MNLEIERKFLVTLSLKDILCLITVKNKLFISQSYMSNTGNWTMRIRRAERRISGKRLAVDFYLTMKKKMTSVSCVEIEQQITKRTYDNILSQCGHTLVKTRYEFNYAGRLWELDHFTQPPFQDLLVAEIELKHEDEVFVAPPWIGEEVTHDRQYKNAKMVKRIGEQS